MEKTCSALLDILPEAIARYDLGLRITFANRSFERLANRSAAVVGKTLLEVFEQEAVAQWYQTLQHVRLSGAPACIDAQLPGAGEAIRYCQVEVLPEFAAEGEVVALLSVTRDVTVQRQAKAELIHSRQQLAQQHEELTRVNGHLENFVYTVAHDLRSPVGNLGVLTNLLLERPHDEDSQMLMEHMQLSLKQLESTITDLVEVLEVQSTFKVAVHLLQLEDIYAEVTSELAANIPTSATLEADFSALPELTYIRSYLISVFRNLIGNALKYRANERPLLITIKAWREAGFAVLSFRDNGIGIDLASHGHKLFLPFSRLTSLAEGKGIGL
ncbi:MAG TPA: PAS domain-containing protein, partial [Hymenobacter sp.]